jgi:hypothetical protein
MITRSMKRVVLTIIETSREVSDAWKRQKAKSELERIKFLKAMNRLEKAIERLDRMSHAEEKTHR